MAGTDVMRFCIAWRKIRHVWVLSCTRWCQHQAIGTSVLLTWRAYEWNKVTPIKPVKASSVSIILWSYHFFPFGAHLRWTAPCKLSHLHTRQQSACGPDYIQTGSFLLGGLCFCQQGTDVCVSAGCIKVHTWIEYCFCNLNPVCVYICWSPGDPDRGLLHRVPALLLWWRRSNKHSWKWCHLRFPGSTALHQRGLCTHFR